MERKRHASELLRDGDRKKKKKKKKKNNYDEENETDLTEVEVSLLLPKDLLVENKLSEAEKMTVAKAFSIYGTPRSVDPNDDDDYDGYIINLGEETKRSLEQIQSEMNISVTVSASIENIVLTFKLCVDEINRVELARKLYSKGASFNPKRFASVTIKLHPKPGSVLLIFSTGSVVITGVQSKEAASLNARRVTEMIRTIGGYRKAKMKDLTVRNIVGCLRLGVNLDLRALCSELEGACYDKENFPGVIFHTPEYRTHFLIYESGSIVITGAKTNEDIEDGARFIAPYCIRAIKGSKSAKRSISISNYGMIESRKTI